MSGKGVFVAAGTDTALTAESLPAVVNLTASGAANPWTGDGGIAYVNGTRVLSTPTATGTGAASTGTGSSGSSGAAPALRVRAEVLVVAVGVVLGAVMAL